MFDETMGINKAVGIARSLKEGELSPGNVALETLKSVKGILESEQGWDSNLIDAVTLAYLQEKKKHESNSLIGDKNKSPLEEALMIANQLRDGQMEPRQIALSKLVEIKETIEREQSRDQDLIYEMIHAIVENKKKLYL